MNVCPRNVCLKAMVTFYHFEIWFNPCTVLFFLSDNTLDGGRADSLQLLFT